ncbi:hypothetical protein RND81_08G121500 [Saponaria officinalis]|uniref:Uncharacterized protein n=1 Tax=Saponaria officinalis TaxID=3572 RepID=A0AAW1J6J7_SAPOF
MNYLSFAVCLLLALAAIKLLQFSAKKHRTLPPGPAGLPVFGNLFSLGDKPHITLAKLATTYGSLMTLRLGRVHTVVISSAEMAKEALQKNDISFCNRNVVDAVRAHNHHQNSVVWLPASSKWRKLRRTGVLDASQGLRRNKVGDLLFCVEKNCADGTSVDIGPAAFTTSLNLLSTTFFSVDLSDPNSDFAGEFKKITREMIEELGKPNFADYFPVLRRLDIQGIRRRTSVHFGRILGLFNTMIEQRLKNGKSLASSRQGADVLDSLLGIDEAKTEDIDPSEFSHLLLDLFGGGIDTTATTLEWAMAELFHRPEKLKKAKDELQQVIRKGNSVEEHDIARLPYLQAVVKETLRLHPPLPFLIPRKVDTDINLLGFTVPKNAQVLVNVWAIGRDPNTWDHPNQFEPERFVGSEIDVKGRDFELIPFGAGRRICTGLPLATRMLHLMLGSLIHGFDWKLEDGTLPEKMDMEEKFGISLEKAQRLRAIPVRL